MSLLRMSAKILLALGQGSGHVLLVGEQTLQVALHTVCSTGGF